MLLDYDLSAEQASSFFAGFKQRELTCRLLMVTAGISDRVALHALEMERLEFFSSTLLPVS